MYFLDNALAAPQLVVGMQVLEKKNYIFRFAHYIEHPTQLIFNTLHN